jgi:hypothetical protein
MKKIFPFSIYFKKFHFLFFLIAENKRRKKERKSFNFLYWIYPISLLMFFAWFFYFFILFLFFSLNACTWGFLVVGKYINVRLISRRLIFIFVFFFIILTFIAISLMFYWYFFLSIKPYGPHLFVLFFISVHGIFKIKYGPWKLLN